MTAIDDWVLMALFFPHCDLDSVDLAGLWRRWTFGGLFRAFSNVCNELPQGGEMRRQVWVLVFVLSSLDSVRLL